MWFFQILGIGTFVIWLYLVIKDVISEHKSLPYVKEFDEERWVYYFTIDDIIRTLKERGAEPPKFSFRGTKMGKFSIKIQEIKDYENRG